MRYYHCVIFFCRNIFCGAERSISKRYKTVFFPTTKYAQNSKNGTECCSRWTDFIQSTPRPRLIFHFSLELAIEQHAFLTMRSFFTNSSVDWENWHGMAYREPRSRSVFWILGEGVHAIPAYRQHQQKKDKIMHFFLREKARLIRVSRIEWHVCCSV